MDVPVDANAFSASTLLSMTVNVIAILTALGVLAVWLRKRVKLAFDKATAQLKSQLARADDELKEKVDGLENLLTSLTNETRRAHERLDRHLETHGYVIGREVTNNG